MVKNWPMTRSLAFLSIFFFCFEDWHIQTHFPVKSSSSILWSDHLEINKKLNITYFLNIIYPCNTVNKVSNTALACKVWKPSWKPYQKIRHEVNPANSAGKFTTISCWEIKKSCFLESSKNKQNQNNIIPFTV